VENRFLSRLLQISGFQASQTFRRAEFPTHLTVVAMLEHKLAIGDRYDAQRAIRSLLIQLDVRRYVRRRYLHRSVENDRRELRPCGPSARFGAAVGEFGSGG